MDYLSEIITKGGKEKGTFIEVGKLLEDSCKSKHMKIHTSKIKFERCSGVVQANKYFVFSG